MSSHEIVEPTLETYSNSCNLFATVRRSCMAVCLICVRVAALYCQSVTVGDGGKVCLGILFF